MSASINVTAFASIIGVAPKKQPYKSQQKIPVVKMMYILKEIPFVFFVFII